MFEQDTVLGFNLYSNFDSVKRNDVAFTYALVKAVIDFISINNIDIDNADYTLEVGVYDWGNGPNDIRVWKVYLV